MPSTETRGTFTISPFYPANNGNNNNNPKTLPRDRSLKRRTDLSADVQSPSAQSLRGRWLQRDLESSCLLLHFTWLEACDMLGTREQHQSLPSDWQEKAAFGALSRSQNSSVFWWGKWSVYIRHSEIFNNRWDLIGPDFLLVLEQPQREGAISRVPESRKLTLLL